MITTSKQKTKIGLWSDAVNFPSLPLMKISAYHKQKNPNCTVKIIDDFNEWFDIAYVSKTFNLPHIKKIPQLPQMPYADELYFGGTGFAILNTDGSEQYYKSNDPTLPKEIEHSYPNYELFPELTNNKAFGFLTRGCANSCPFCIVTCKEGNKSTHVADLSEFWRGQPFIKIMDANILACENVENLLVSLINSKAYIDFTQGLDARLVDEEKSKLLGKLKTNMTHFAFDLIQNETEIIRGLTLFKKYSNTTSRQRSVYILTNYNTSHKEDWYRVKKVIELGYMPDVRIYMKGTHGQFLTDLARWANNRQLYRACSFEDYIPRKDGKRCSELYKDVLKK